MPMLSGATVWLSGTLAALVVIAVAAIGSDGEVGEEGERYESGTLATAEQLLQCPSGETNVLGPPLYDDIPETRSPYQLANQWASHPETTKQWGSVEGQATTSGESQIRFVYTNHLGRAIARLTYEKHPTLGWQLTYLEEC